jgi:ribonucleotide reductase beta subunit family protein with ferritin-like domain
MSELSTAPFVEPLLNPVDIRHVMFQIKYDDIWEMYTRATDCFWVAQEVDLS